MPGSLGGVWLLPRQPCLGARGASLKRADTARLAGGPRDCGGLACCPVGAMGILAWPRGRPVPRGLLRCPGSPWTPTARTFALSSLNAKGFKTQSALAAILSTPSLSSWETRGNVCLLTQQIVLSVCCMPVNEWPLPWWGRGSLARRKGSGEAGRGPCCLPHPQASLHTVIARGLLCSRDPAWHGRASLSFPAGPTAGAKCGFSVDAAPALILRGNPKLLGGFFMDQR